MSLPVQHTVRVLWVIKGLGPGGAEQLLVQHARAHDRERFEYRCVFLVPWKDHHVVDLEREQVEVLGLDAPRPWDLSWLAHVKRLVRDWRPDVVHVHSPLPASLLRIALRMRSSGPRPSLLVSEHNRWQRHRLPTRLANALTYRLDDAHIAVSSGVRDSVPGWLAEDLTVLHHGIDLDAMRDAADREGVRHEFGIPDDATVIGTVANYRREKDYPNLLRAARAVLDRREDVWFLAVGQGPLRSEIEELHAELDLGSRFILTGYREDARRVMSTFDIFTLASQHEGLPVTLMEAFALGLPFVGTAVGGIPEAVIDGEHGALIEPGNPEALGRAYLDLVEHGEIRVRMSARVAADAQRFDVDRAVRVLEDLYLELAGDTPFRSRR